jgi:hypothetical protein
LLKLIEVEDMKAGHALRILFLLICIGGGSAHAEQRALLVGVGAYERPDLNLPGIDLDIERMVDTLKVMGFEDSQIRILADSDATAANVIDSFETWLTDGVEKDDRVVFYYSGHGSFIPDANGDEPDNVDEVLVTHDVKSKTVNGKRTLVGVVSDDRIAEMIRGTASENVLILVDACHSGTMTRDILLSNKSLTDEPVFEKAFVYDGMPVGEDAGMMRSVEVVGEDLVDSAAPTYVAVSAAADDEKAIGTSRGGMFTIGFTDAIKNSVRSGSNATINDLRNAAAEYIRGKLDEKRVHTPQVTGSKALAGGELQILPVGVSWSPMWARLERLASEAQYFPMDTPQRRYKLGEIVEFTLNVPAPGYLNLVTVDAEDNATVLFPNQFDSENKVDAGVFRFPGEDSVFELPALEPLGRTLVVAFVTPEPIDFREAGFDGRTKSGEFREDAVFTSVTYTATRALGVQLKQSESTPAEAPSESPANAASAVAEEEPEPPNKEMYASTLEITVVK